MCGIIAIHSRPSTRAVPSADEVLAGLDAALAVAPDIAAVAVRTHHVDRLLRGVAGVQCMIGRRELVASMTSRLDQLDAVIATAEADLELNPALTADAVELANATLVGLRDAVWAIRNDRLRAGRAVDELAGRDAGDAAIAGYFAVHQALSALDRLEVRGRDSAGVHLYVWNHGLTPDDPAVQALLGARQDNPLFLNGSVRFAGGCISFVYKAAVEIGELGDNTRNLRKSIAADSLLRLALSAPTARLALLGHTRWASVGIISEANCHPLNSEEVESSYDSGPYVVGALNGDVDNHADLKVEYNLRIAGPITTDAKVIPAMVSRLSGVSAGDLTESFRRTVSSFEGSVAIGAASAQHPDQLLLALRGSGQALYVGLAEDTFIVASEPYGVVEETTRYVRMDGETAAHPDQPMSRGQVFALSMDHAGELEGIRRISYDGTELPISADEVVTAEVTTRDIDRGASPHFLLKEISEAPNSFRKTLRAKIVEHDGLLRASVGDRAMPPEIVERLRNGGIRRVLVIGQGTAAVAGRSVATTLDVLVEGGLDVDPIVATELSGFGMRLDMSDTLVIAVSQSGTTTDTNRTVDLVRGRGALVIGIVNRRNSDLTDKADGVLYTSDGRDVEMSVASTKAFYAQVAAGTLLACAISEAAGLGSDTRRHELLTSLREMPDAMREVLELRANIGDAAQKYAPQRRYWTVVGNGVNAVAAQEVRIKLSELCYKSIACDFTEDKKHIDLSCEPLILVCAAGLVGGTADDVAKEVAIFRAHKALPIVIATVGETRFSAAAHVVSVPVVDPALAFILSAMVGHLFGYEAALAIDASARPLREARELIERVVGATDVGDEVVRLVTAELGPIAERFMVSLRSNLYDGQLEASTAVRLTSMLRSALSPQPLEAYQFDTGKLGTPSLLIDDLTAALTRAIEELTRPIDAIKHQAKTVTVGISRSDEGVLDRNLVQAVLTAGVGRDRLSYKSLKVLADLDPAVADVVGFTRYRIEGDPESGDATISILDRGGLSRDVPSRVERNSSLLGTKRRVAAEREVLVAQGRSDGRTVIFVPEVKANHTTGITLLHVRFHERLPASTMRGVLQGYDRRYDRLVDWVAETEGGFREDRLSEVSVADLLILPISEMADHWRA
ncbi:MAG: glmS [Acidimicrobiales bacterium]|nr:glmS [Acidimicrobiales bacterium]